ncbi:aminotransferase class I/II-fold pyridoxal phosphate-dependent enzyme [Pedobacter jejuensis]|uniref:Aminotransferase class I/II-fold pyridoxal phosphate-dependent enzyme n=1 Tax=Pedobacter jejuensis TaxID=1268550 RepID=A0A3N0BP67_9SPHI|nr:aminotransferase class I/II-fold pyridoxal phosphate-dependent enzyme [Pedobacter jejuensis]RNL50691.1 aminotransferase class I/II-fold pyridoxal phosphate-dependent enzyme [Pedobacter jejuensis]
MHSDFKSISQPFANSIKVDGVDYLYFGGTAYLGIPQNEEFIKLYIEGIKLFGLNNGTSRTNNIQLGIYDEAENVAAHRFGSENALITSSGYLAAQLTVKALSGTGQVIYAPATHPALWLENQPLQLKAFSDWKIETTELINNSMEQNWVIISNSMNNLFPELYDFGFLEKINADKKITLIVDDSHGIGINNNGLSAYSSLPIKSNIETIVVASMAKALGVDAGLVLGSEDTIEKLKNTNTFVGASPPPAAALYAFINGNEIYKSAWIRLQSNIALLESKIKISGKFEAGFPVFHFEDSNLAERLLFYQILISSFPYPNANDAPINRIVLSSWHSEADILKIASLL